MMVNFVQKYDVEGRTGLWGQRLPTKLRKHTNPTNYPAQSFGSQKGASYLGPPNFGTRFLPVFFQKSLLLLIVHYLLLLYSRMLPVHKLLEGKRDHITWTVPPDCMVIEALQLMTEKNIGAVLVMDGERLAGIFSERDYARKGIIQGRKAKSTPVTEVMTANVITVTKDMSIEDCMNLFNRKRIRHLPVVEDDKVVGLLSIGDIVHAIIQEQSTHIQFLEQYISGT